MFKFFCNIYFKYFIKLRVYVGHKLILLERLLQGSIRGVNADYSVFNLSKIVYLINSFFINCVNSSFYRNFFFFLAINNNLNKILVEDVFIKHFH
jgi:hypothetical protein